MKNISEKFSVNSSCKCIESKSSLYACNHKPAILWRGEVAPHNYTEDCGMVLPFSLKCCHKRRDFSCESPDKLPQIRKPHVL